MQKAFSVTAENVQHLQLLKNNCVSLAIQKQTSFCMWNSENIEVLQEVKQFKATKAQSFSWVQQPSSQRKNKSRSKPAQESRLKAFSLQIVLQLERLKKCHLSKISSRFKVIESLKILNHWSVCVFEACPQGFDQKRTNLSCGALPRKRPKMTKNWSPEPSNMPTIETQKGARRTESKPALKQWKQLPPRRGDLLHGIHFGLKVRFASKRRVGLLETEYSGHASVAFDHPKQSNARGSMFSWPPGTSSRLFCCCFQMLLLFHITADWLIFTGCAKEPQWKTPSPKPWPEMSNVMRA